MSDQKIAEVISIMDVLIEDNSIPRNIRKVVGEAKESLKKEDETSTRVSSAIQSLIGVSEDINMPMHARTQIWTILSALESIET